MAQNLKQKILTCLTKLADRDTYTQAATELNSIAQSLDPTSLPTFLSCILSTDSSDKSAVRRQCINLLSLLSEIHGNALSPYLNKILSHLTRRLRDPDSSTRSACISTVSTLSSSITKLPFPTTFLKPLSEALFTEQDPNAQIGAALCLAAAIDGSPDPDPARLGRMVPRLEKLLKCEGFRGKAGVLVVIGSVIGSGGVSGSGHGVGLRSLVNCLVEFLSNEDWAARKAAAEALGRLAVMERDSLAEFKAGCLKVFETRRFDKVKAVREVMNQMMEPWKQVPDLSEEVSPPPKSVASSKEDASDGRFLPGSKKSCTPGSVAAQMRRKSFPAMRSTPPDGSSATIARKRSPLKSSSATKTTPAMLRKKPVDWKVEISVPNAGSFTGVCEDGLNENVLETGYKKPETKRALFGKNSEDKTHKFGGLRSGSRVAPCHEESSQSTVLVCNGTENLHGNHKESEDLSLIRNQLLQIEKQQSSLLDLLQRFIGSSQNGMRSLETRVHGLELALDEISYDLAVSSGRMTDSHGTTCCLLPGAGFLSSKFWKKSEGRYLNSRFSTSHGTPSLAARHYRADESGNAETFQLESHRLRLQGGGGGGFIVNPLAEIHSDSRGISEVAHP